MIRDVPYLNGLRAMAALWVVIAHCMIWGGWTATRIPDPKIAVDLFMLVSGFLMAMNARQRESIEPMNAPYSWVIFYMRRFFRLAPAYYLSLLLAVFAQHEFLTGYKILQNANPLFWGGAQIYDPLRTAYTLNNILLHFTFTFGLMPRYAFSTFLPDWSLGLEMQFYIVFPFIFLLMRRIGALLAASILGIMSWVISTHLQGVFPEPAFLPLKLSLFLLGMAIESFSFDGRRSFAVLGLAIALPFAQVASYPSQSWLLLAVCLAMLALSWPGSTKITLGRLAHGLLGSRLAHQLSDASYGLYLFHGFFISVAGHLFFTSARVLAFSRVERCALLLAFVLPCSLAVARLVHAFVEGPGIRVGRNLIYRMKIPPAAAS